MTAPQYSGMSKVDFERFVAWAGLSVEESELENLKNLYELYSTQVSIIHTVDLQAGEMGVTFRPDWPAV